MAKHTHTQGVDQWVSLVGGIKFSFAANVGQAEAVAVATHAGHHSVHHTRGVRVLGCTKTQLIHHRHRAGTHGNDVADDATHARSRALVGLHETRVVMGLHLEGDSPAVTNIHDTSVLTHTHEQMFTHLVGSLGAKLLLEVLLGRLIGAVLRPHHRVHSELRVSGTAAEQLANALVLLLLQAKFGPGHRLVGGCRGVGNRVVGLVKRLKSHRYSCLKRAARMNHE